MESREQNDLEKFIHAQLQKLPDREAPESLVGNVLSAIAARKKLPWWKQSFNFWPRQGQCLLFAALVLVFGAVIYGTGRAADTVSLPDVSGRLSSYAWIGRTARAIGESLVLAVSGLHWQWLAAIALVFILLYAACLAAGFALFRVTASAGPHTA
jgi:hypothetical protein